MVKTNKTGINIAARPPCTQTVVVASFIKINYHHDDGN